MADEIIRVLYLDDEEANLFSFKAAFRREFEVHTCIEPHQAVRLMDEHEFHVVLSDQRMPRISGVEFFELVMPDHPDVSRVLVTGYADTDAVVDAINKGQVYRFVSKPWNEEELRTVIRLLDCHKTEHAKKGMFALNYGDGHTICPLGGCMITLLVCGKLEESLDEAWAVSEDKLFTLPSLRGTKLMIDSEWANLFGDFRVAKVAASNFVFFVVVDIGSTKS